MTTIPSALPPTAGSKAASSATSLGSTDFLRLMTEQMKEQDPFAPQDNSQMIAQLAQIGSSSGISDLNGAMKGIAAKLDSQTTLLQAIVDRLAPLPATPTTTASA